MRIDDLELEKASVELVGGGEKSFDHIQDEVNEAIEKKSSNSFPEPVIVKFPFLTGNDDAPFWKSWTNLRAKAFKLIENEWYEKIVLALIILSSFALVSCLMSCTQF